MFNFEYIVRESKSKKGEITVKTQNLSPLIEIKMDGKVYKYKVVHNELVEA